MRFKRPEIICENCLARFEFTESDIHGDLGEEYELFVTCPYCDEEIEIESVEDYETILIARDVLLDTDPIAGSKEYAALEYIDTRIQWYEVEVSR